MVLLPTTVVGSYSVPEWLERLKTEYYQRRISARHLAEIHDVAIKAAVKDQELAGIDIVSDGELRRDNDVDYFLARIPGVHIPQRAKTDYFDYYDAEVAPAAARGADRDRRSRARARRRFPVHPPAHPAAGQVLLHRSLLAVPADPRRRLLRSPATWSARSPAGSTPRPASWPRPARTSCRSTSPSWPGTRSTSSSRSRRSTWWSRAYPRRGRCTCATATGTRARPGKGTTIFCSPR